VLNILDAANLERNLYLTTQLPEMNVPVLVAVNMLDIAEARGLKIDLSALADRLGCPVYGVVAAEGRGIAALKAALACEDDLLPPQIAPFHVPQVRAAVADLRPALEALVQARHLDPDWAALSLLESDSLLERSTDPTLQERLETACAALSETLGEDIDIVLAEARYGFIDALMAAVQRDTRRVSATLSDRIDRVVLNRILGVPIFLAFMYLMFLFTIDLGGALIDFFDLAAGALFVDGLGALMEAMGSPDRAPEILATGLGGGVQTVATFVLIVVFLFLSALEDSGYMARAAFVMDRAMRAIGLPGKAFVLLIVGFGCNVPAVMASRTIERPGDRILTIVMAPFMSCGARLPVYALFAAVFFPAGRADRVPPLSRRDRGADPLGAGAQGHAAFRSGHALRDGTAALSSAHPARRGAAHLGKDPQLRASGNEDHRADGSQCAQFDGRRWQLRPPVPTSAKACSSRGFAAPMPGAG